jgi:hypothetical protein
MLNDTCSKGQVEAQREIRQMRHLQRKQGAGVFLIWISGDNLRQLKKWILRLAFMI